jgi:amino acid transporter/Xaa-Pro aminopeptidase
MGMDTRTDIGAQPKPAGPELPRVLGLFSIVSIVVGTMIGSGIFINPAKVAGDVGRPELMMAVWVIGGLLSFFGALSLAELGAAFPQAGGIYIYLREAYGSMIAFLFGWTLFLVVEAGTLATLAVGFSTKYLPYFVRLSGLQGKVVAAALLLVLAMVNYTGVKKGALVMNFLTSLKFIALIGVCAVVFIFAKGSTGNFISSPSTSGPGGSLLGSFGVALVAALWAYKGWETSTYSAGETANPQKTLPLGLFIGSAAVIFLYILANLAYLYVFPAARMAQSDRIAADVMQAAVGPAGASIIALIILTSILGTCNGHLLTSPRAFYAMAKDGLFFKSVARIHPRYLTPHVAILVLAVWGSILSTSGTFEQLFTYVIFGYWIFMGLTVAGVMVLRKKRPDLPRPYKTWGYPVTPILFILSAVFLTLNSLIRTFWNSFAGLGVIALGIPVYFFWKARSRKAAVLFLAAFVIMAASAQAFEPGLLFDKTEYAGRRARLMEKIPDGVAVVMGAQPVLNYYPFVQNNDFLYLCGVRVPNAVLVVDGVRRESTLFFTISDRAARDEGIPLALVKNTREVAGVERVMPYEAFNNALSMYIAQGRVIYTPFQPEELAREASLEKLRTWRNNITLNVWDGRPTREEQFVNRLRQTFPSAQVRDCSGLIWEMRTLKSPAEVEVLRRAGRIGVKAHVEMMKAARPGMYEYELAALFEYICKKEGAEELAYGVIISSGENHPNVHYYLHDRKLADGDFLVVDAGPELNGYDIDITVSYPANGRFTARQREVYEACNAVHEACLQVYRPGLTADQVRAEVDAILKRRGFDLEKDYFKRMRGSFGHYVGLATHDVGGGPSVLRPGMVFANEPMVIYADENLGVRVEDTVLITETGCENLTRGLPRTAAEIEALMKGKAAADKGRR